MAEAFYNILILALGVLGMVRGFRFGLTGQVSSIIGFAFGAVSAHAFIEEGEGLVRTLFPHLECAVGGQFICSVIAAGSIYLFVYFCFNIFTGILRRTMSFFHIGLLDSLMGAAFGLFKYLLGLSLLFNLIVSCYSGSVLMKSSVASDGNLIEGVMGIAPWALGCFSYEEYAHLLQLNDARKISEAKTIDSQLMFYLKEGRADNRIPLLKDNQREGNDIIKT